MADVGTSANATTLKRPKADKPAKAAKPSSSAPPLGKFLASSEKPVRDKAVASLSKFLHGKKYDAVAYTEECLEQGELDWDAEYKPDSRLAPLEMAKLWKGIYFCFWMSDKPLVQQALATDLALLLLACRSKKGTGRVARLRSSLCYLKGFWQTIVREWTGLDRHRLDKFYLLIRRFVHASFLLLARENWDRQAIAEYNAILTGPGGPLHVLDSKIPHSICYHLADIYVDEIEAALSKPIDGSEGTKSTCVPLLALLEPFYTTLSICPSKAMFARIADNVFIPLFEATIPKPDPALKRRKIASETVVPTFPSIGQYALERVNKHDVADDEYVGKAMLAELFTVGGKETTGDVNRRRMYALHRERGEHLEADGE